MGNWQTQWLFSRKPGEDKISTGFVTEVCDHEGVRWPRLPAPILRESRFPHFFTTSSPKKRLTSASLLLLSEWYKVQQRSTFVEEQILNEVATCWILIQLLLSNNSVFWKWWIMKCFSLCAARIGVVQKRKTEKFELERAIKNKTSFPELTIHPALDLLVQLR